MFTPNETLQLVREGITTRDGAAAVEPGQDGRPAAALRHDGDEHQAPGALRPRCSRSCSAVDRRPPLPPTRARSTSSSRTRPRGFHRRDRDVAEDTDFAAKLQRLISVVEAFESKKADLVATLLLSGASLKCYDGQNMFDTDRGG